MKHSHMNFTLINNLGKNSLWETCKILAPAVGVGHKSSLGVIWLNSTGCYFFPLARINSQVWLYRELTHISAINLQSETKLDVRCL